MRLLPTILFHGICIGTLLITGCAPSTVDQLTKETEARQLSANEIFDLARGNTLFLQGHRSNSYFYFDKTGLTFARDIFNNTDKGRWDVSDHNELCFKMDDWWLSELRCFPVYQDEEKYYLFNSSGVLEFSAQYNPGDSENLYRELTKSKKTFFLANNSKPEKLLVPKSDAPKKTNNIDKSAPATEMTEDELKSTVRMVAKDCPGCNLKDANLQGADLIGAQLEGADLTRANLSKANLRRANLQDADLEDANLMYANMPGANLRDCDLTDANLTGANLIRADLTGADIDGAIFADALLEGVEGLQQ